MNDINKHSGVVKVVVSENGPYIVLGYLPLNKATIEVDKDGQSLAWSIGAGYQVQETYRLCRCGQSRHKPFCDGTHGQVGFNGAETAGHESYLEQARRITGPALTLTDLRTLCSSARFCDRAGGIWRLTLRSANPASMETAIEEAHNCPSGRLVVWNPENVSPVETVMKPGISLVEDPSVNVSGPIWLKGGVRLESSDGTCYEARNRVTVCRCGQSKNKPFCDGSHIPAAFKA